MCCAGAFFSRESEGFSNHRRNALTTDNLCGVLGNGPHHIDYVNDLKTPLFTGFDWLLAGNHQHGHSAKLCIGSRRYQVGSAGTERGQADAHLTGESTVGCSHKPRALLVSGKYQLNG